MTGKWYTSNTPVSRSLWSGKMTVVIYPLSQLKATTHQLQVHPSMLCSGMLGSADPISALPGAGSSACHRTSWETRRLGREKGLLVGECSHLTPCLLAAPMIIIQATRLPLGSGQSLQQHWDPVGRTPHTSRTSHSQRSQRKLAPRWVPAHKDSQARGPPSPQVDFSPVTVAVQSLSRVQPFATPWTAAHQASLPLTISRSSPKFMSSESVMPSNHLIPSPFSPPAFSLSQLPMNGL